MFCVPVFCNSPYQFMCLFFLYFDSSFRSIKEHRNQEQKVIVQDEQKEASFLGTVNFFRLGIFTELFL